MARSSPSAPPLCEALPHAPPPLTGEKGTYTLSPDKQSLQSVFMGFLGFSRFLFVFLGISSSPLFIWFSGMFLSTWHGTECVTALTRPFHERRFL